MPNCLFCLGSHYLIDGGILISVVTCTVTLTHTLRWRQHNGHPHARSNHISPHHPTTNISSTQNTISIPNFIPSTYTKQLPLFNQPIGPHLSNHIWFSLLQQIFLIGLSCSPLLCVLQLHAYLSAGLFFSYKNICLHFYCLFVVVIYKI